ncbi:MAG TPA: VCBS repeat-containing protein [Candidatus Sulfotelmatobacter sp.]|nr:VCBS repeat-containing protein [Candidatus Sulfotelmatobacter sp.]
MKTRLVFATLFVTSLAAFGTRTQPKPSSQFRVTHSRQSSKANHRTALQERGGAAARPAAAGKTTSTNPASKGRFKSRPLASSSTSTVSFVAGTRTAWGGSDDQVNETVMGDFNGDGKMDVARIVTNVVSATTAYQIAVLLSNGDGTFKTGVVTNTNANTDDPIIAGDLKGRGTDDVVQVHPTGGFCGAAQPATGHPSVLPCGPSIDVMISNGDGTFATPVNYVVSGNNLMGGLLTDVNGDGKLDLLTFDSSIPANVIELLGNGDGTFQAAVTLGTLTTNAPNNMIFADFNGDGKIDFAGQTETGVQVTLATGPGLFANAPVSLSTPDGQHGACNSTTGDLTGDGKPEIVSFNCNANTVTVYVNNGDGTFGTGVYYNNNSDQNQGIYDGTIADVNGDGKNDVVAVDEYGGDVSVFLGHGDGSLTVQPASYEVGGFAWNTPLIADFNGDGLADIVESDDLYNLVYLQGYGDGTFRAAFTNPLPNSFDQNAYTYSVATGDFNGDGILDVVVGEVNNNGSPGVAVYLGRGDGTFYAGDSYGTSTRMSFVAVADFNGDGKLDIAAIDEVNDVVQIFMGNGDGTFSMGLAYPTSPLSGAGAENLVVGDFNKDGKMDIAVANFNTGDVGVLLGQGDGSFASAVSYPVKGYALSEIAAADLNGDGYLDLAVTAVSKEGGTAVVTLLSNKDAPGTFGAGNFVTVNGRAQYIALGDLNKDGKIDMAVTENKGATFNGQLEIFLNDGTGTFPTAPTAYPASTFGGAAGDSYPLDIQMFDMNGDGNLDLVYLNDDYGTVAIALGNGDGTIAAPVEFPTTEYVQGLALADVDGDGTMDILTGEDEAGGFSVFMNGAGSGAAQNYTLGTSTPSVTVAAGSPASYVLDLAGLNGYTGTITFACGELPTAATCSFNPSSVIALGNTPLTTTLTIDTTVRSGSLLRPARPGAKPGSPILLVSLGGMGLLGLLLAGSGAKGRRRRAAIVLGAVLLLTVGAMMACDNENATKTITIPPPPPATGTPAGSYLVTVTSTGTGTGAPTHSVNVILIVQ